MFYHLYHMKDLFSPLRVFQYITVRTLAGAGTAFLFSIVIGPWLIKKLHQFGMVQYVRTEDTDLISDRLAKKKGTATTGGIMIIAAILVSTLLWARPGNVFVLLVLATLCYMGMVGFWDDYLSITRKHSKGLNAKSKIGLQVLWAVAVVTVMFHLPETQTHVRQLMVPFFKYPILYNMGAVGAAVFVTIVIVGASNAVNLTDGLDGLAIGCSSSVALSYLIMSYVAGHFTFADYLGIPFISGSGELAVLCGCMMGACLGFLWYNCHPAQVFMGDTGSLALGGAIAMIALLIKQELVLVIVGGVFVMEALSVIIQVASFKLRGKRVFAMSPLHHHFEVKQWSETQITVRFWILSIIFAFLGILALKIR